MKFLSDEEINEVIKQEVGDPRPELKDHKIWERFLYLLIMVVPIRIYQMFRGIRACGAKFNTKMEFLFPEEFDIEFKNIIKDKYIIPNAKIIQAAIKECKGASNA
jgi:hypothetical protein